MFLPAIALMLVMAQQVRQPMEPTDACNSFNRGEVVNDYRCTEQTTGFVWVKRQLLHCAKLEHEVHLPQRCANTCPPDGTICTTECRILQPEDYCAPDLHEVTEKEWQELMERLKSLQEAVKLHILVHSDGH